MDKDQELRGWKSHCVELQNKVDRLELENSRLQAAIDAANAQEHVASINGVWELRWAGSGPIVHIAEKHGLKIGDRLYARPIPAQQSQVSTSDKVLFNGSHGHAGYVIEEQQSQAVTDCDHLDSWQIAEGTKCDCNKSTAISKTESTARITERDVMAVLAAREENPLTIYEKWVPGLINKINEGKNHGN